MTLDEIESRINTILVRKGDPGGAHSDEDKLRADFIAYVASLDMLPTLSEKAKLVLTTDKIDFERW